MFISFKARVHTLTSTTVLCSRAACCYRIRSETPRPKRPVDRKEEDLNAGGRKHKEGRQGPFEAVPTTTCGKNKSHHCKNYKQACWLFLIKTSSVGIKRCFLLSSHPHPAGSHRLGFTACVNPTHHLLYLTNPRILGDTTPMWPQLCSGLIYSDDILPSFWSLHLFASCKPPTDQVRAGLCPEGLLLDQNPLLYCYRHAHRNMQTQLKDRNGKTCRTGSFSSIHLRPNMTCQTLFHVSSRVQSPQIDNVFPTETRRIETPGLFCWQSSTIMWTSAHAILSSCTQSEACWLALDK